MSEIQAAVNAINEAMKTEWMIVVWYRSAKGRVIKRTYQGVDVLKAVADAYEPGLIPLESLYREVRVGTNNPDETPTGGYGE